MEKRLNDEIISKLYSWSRAINTYVLAEQKSSDTRATVTLYTISLEQHINS